MDSKPHLATEFLANERTFLAWIRTSIAVISLGFVIARFSTWLRELGPSLEPHVPRVGGGSSLPLGEAMIAFGALLPVIAAWRYHVVNTAIENGEVKADRWLVITITVVVSVLAAAMVVYLRGTNGQ